MKKAYQVLLILGGCLCAGGIIVSTASFAALGFRPEYLTTEEQRMVQKTYQHHLDGITALEIDTENQAVELIPTEESTLTIQYRQPASGAVEPVFTETETEDGRALKMKYHDDREWWQKIRLFQFYSDDTIRVYLPSAYRGRILVETKNGPVKGENLFLDDTLTLKTSNGSIQLKHITAAGLETRTSNTPIRLENCTVAENAVTSTTNASISISSLQAVSLTSTTSNSSIALKDSRLSEECTLKTSSGSVICSNVEAGSHSVKTSNSSISLTQVSAGSTLTAVNSNGSIKTAGVAADEISLNTTNAAVTGTIAGPESDYSIITNTTNASNNTPGRLNENASKKLIVNTTNGKIDIRFE